ncbi:MAG: 2-phosphosulfolactate phosphatase [Chloroflexi bacterium]|nr:2-phosphosulfolactate phosphatase [Chloroflexota bacterium]
MRVDVIETPGLITDLRGRLCVVVDVLRATTTAVVALAAGAREIVPCLDREETMAKRSRCQGRSLLGGEEMGRRIRGFDLGNSPLEYAGKMAGLSVFFCTTNGTVAVRRAYEASGHPVYLGALVNLSAVAGRAAEEAPAEGIALVCSGRQGELSAEDLFCCGLLVERVGAALRRKGASINLGDAALVAAHFARANEGKAHNILASSEHGRYLASIGFEKDIEFAARLDVYDLVPVFDGGRIVAAQQMMNAPPHDPSQADHEIH